MKKIFLTALAAICCILSAVQSEAQSKSADRVSGKQFYAECGGPGILFSASFDSRFVRGHTHGLGYRIGAGIGADVGKYFWDGMGSDDGTYATFPLGINYVFGRSTSVHTFEAGAGVTIFSRMARCFSTEDESHWTGSLSFMYRRQPIGGGFTWRAGFTPLLGSEGNIVPMGCVGVGYSF